MAGVLGTYEFLGNISLVERSGRWWKQGGTIMRRVFTATGKILARPAWCYISVTFCTCLGAALITVPPFFHPPGFTVGDVSDTTVISPVEFTVPDDAATRKYRDDVLKSVRPVYDLDDQMVHEVLARIGTSFEFMRERLGEKPEQDSQWGLESRQGSPAVLAGSDPNLAPPLNDQDLRTRFEHMLGTTVSHSGFMLLKFKKFNKQIEADLRSLVVQVLLRGVVVNRELIRKEQKRGILLWIRSKNTFESLTDFSRIFDLKEAVSFVNSWKNDPLRDTALSRTIRSVAMSLVNVNITYNQQKSLSVRQAAMASVKPIHFSVAKGEAIVKKGDPVTETHVRKLAELDKRNSGHNWYMIPAGFAIILALLMWLCLSVSEKFFGRRQYRRAELLLVCGLFLATVLMIRVVGSFSLTMNSWVPGLPGNLIFYAVPIAVGPMFVALLLDAPMAFVFTALISAVSVLVLNGDIYLCLYYVVSGTVGLHGMRRINHENSVFGAGMLMCLANAVSILCIALVSRLPALAVLYAVTLGIVGGLVSALLVRGLVLVTEALGCVTTVKLLKSVNLNHPLLQRIALEAPGTYYHSVMVANLAEAAALVIDINPVLVKAGALYHDVGKVGETIHPACFAENQDRAEVSRKKPDPRANALMLLSHVRAGVEAAQQHGLGKPVLDIIEQHHGTTRIAPQRGVSQDDTPEWRYEGPLPQTKEAALIMLADIVEIASRSWSDPTPSSIKKQVHAIVVGLFQDGQFEQSSLTLKDLDAITKSFIRTLQRDSRMDQRFRTPTALLRKSPTFSISARLPAADFSGAKEAVAEITT